MRRMRLAAVVEHEARVQPHAALVMARRETARADGGCIPGQGSRGRCTLVQIRTVRE